MIQYFEPLSRVLCLIPDGADDLVLLSQPLHTLHTHLLLQTIVLVENIKHKYRRERKRIVFLKKNYTPQRQVCARNVGNRGIEVPCFPPKPYRFFKCKSSNKKF